MTSATDVKMFSDELLMAIGVTFEPVEWDDTPQPDAAAPAVVDRALDELVSNALAIRCVTLNGVLGVAALARQSISLRRFLDEALSTPQRSVYGDDGWEVHLELALDGGITQIELYRRAVTLTERFQ